eukprot:CAMPEP_0168318832 /NCGR_PEP_ID=MMETSP0213-20121227/707_1 /TAXON_ID=151035 /ORGANISM="Euplotes harpa, Strain FSP1.4" /LENGTH=114 /DNA_ID=CAMNT_0008319961 /DNA_START=119 /DNA_END=463 /DNA_ORIENTATION=+
MTRDFIALGTSDGYKIFSLNPIKLIKEKSFGHAICQIGFYSSDKIIWFVGEGELPDPTEREFVFWDNHNDEQLFKIMQKTDIKRVCVKQQNIIVALVGKVYVYSLPISSNMVSK